MMVGPNEDAGWTDVSGGLTKFGHGPYKGSTYEQIATSEEPERKKWTKKIVETTSAKVSDLPLYQQRFKLWYEQTHGTTVNMPQCPNGCDFVKKYANETHETYMCTRCKFKESRLRPPPADLTPPDQCDHPLNRRSHRHSSKDYVNYFCTKCNTSIDRVLRTQHERSVIAGNAVQESGEREHRM